MGKKLSRLYPLVVAMFPILSIYSSNLDQVSPRDVISSAALVVVITSALFWLVGAVMSSTYKTALLAGFGVLLFFSYGAATLALIQVLGSGQYDHVLLPAFTIAFGVVAVLVHRMKSDREALSPKFMVVLGAMLLIPVGKIAIKSVQTLILVTAGLFGTTTDEAAKNTSATIQSQELTGLAAPPDVYYIILDAYGRQDLLQEIYHFDNSPFLSELRKHGFWIGMQSRSNYVQTLLSLSSSLNMGYLDDLATEAQVELSSQELLQGWIRSSKVSRRLRGLDYEFVTFGTGVDETSIKDSDVYYRQPFDLSEFEIHVLGLTPIPYAVTVLGGPQLGYDIHKQRIEYTLNELPAVAERAGRKFVIAHIVAPHPPFVFAENNPHITERHYHMGDGSHYYSSGDEDARRLYIELYTKQIQALNQLVLKAVSGIIERSSQPPIIVIQGDHGPASRWDWDDQKNSDVNERTGILNALLLPGVDTSALDSELSAVNNFRVIFNAYLGSEMPLLENRNYYSSWNEPFEFIDITGELPR